MKNAVQLLQGQLTETMVAIEAIENEAGEVLTEEQVTKMEELTSTATGIRRQLAARQSAEDLKSGASKPQSKVGAKGTVPALSAVRDTTKFSLGETAIAMRAQKLGQRLTDRQMNALSVYANEGTDADGKLAAPPELRTTIERYVYGQTSLLSYATNIPLSGRSVTFPVDDTTPWAAFSGTGKVTKKGEAAALDQVKPAIGSLTITPDKYGVIVPVTEELLEDAPAFGAYITAKVGESMVYELNQAIISGSSSGLKSILGSSALKTVASASGQPVGTVVAKNVMDLYFGMLPESRINGVWLVNPAVEPQLYGMVISGTTTAAYVPGGSMANAPHSLLLGRPVLPLPNMPALGAVGDIVFADLSKYWAVTKGGVRADVSVDFYFDQVVDAFRFYIRVGGDTRRQTVTTLPGGLTQSAFVTLAAR
ncbi:phage major capsid protein [Anaeromyxobacter sp. PSR-1]|uniref:phage major capsid protein n=1 Tax=Anaeromyxobacter sp. PSR-1 TaxID=1300915 RepID=UPI0005DFB7E3|nr:phage major capsid protein [Anaeromyxobacter sp. PSR-1]GAO01957.1 phage capsid family protein [Anaeromyxobacter sp. PSR-1]